MHHYEIDVDRLNRMLEAAVRRCLYAAMEYCDAECQAMDYCRPWTKGLEILGDEVKQGGQE